MNGGGILRPGGKSPLDISTMLQDKEREDSLRMVQEYQKKIMGVVEKIKALMVEEGLKVKDWYAIKSVIDESSMSVITNLTIKDIYEPVSGKEVDGEGKSGQKKGERRSDSKDTEVSSGTERS